MYQRATGKAKNTKVTRIVRVERGRHDGMWLVGLSGAIAIVIFGVFVWPGIGTPSDLTDVSATAADTDRVASVVVHQGTRRCEHKIFDNQTGRILDATTPCAEEMVLDADGNPLPAGTMRRLNSISKSFKKE